MYGLIGARADSGSTLIPTAASAVSADDVENRAARQNPPSRIKRVRGKRHEANSFGVERGMPHDFQNWRSEGKSPPIRFVPGRANAGRRPATLPIVLQSRTPRSVGEQLSPRWTRRRQDAAGPERGRFLKAVRSAKTVPGVPRLYRNRANAGERPVGRCRTPHANPDTARGIRRPGRDRHTSGLR